MKRAILTSIGGCMGPADFRAQTLLPYARTELPAFAQAYGQDPEVRCWLDDLAMDAGNICMDRVLVEVLQGWIEQDHPHPALAALEGMIWEQGYRQGRFQSPLYPDVVPALRAWQASGHALHTWDVASAAAQQRHFRFSQAGDLRPLFAGWFDAMIGARDEPASYRLIAARTGREPGDVVFLSGNVAELDAARDAGLATVRLDRHADQSASRTVAAAHGHVRVESFGQILPDAR